MAQDSTTATQTSANFTGKLLRRKHELGEKFVQLVFRDDDHEVVCVSTNLRTATLPVGQSYRVKGVFTYRGKQTIVLDPKIADPKKYWRSIRRATFAVIVLGCVSGIGAAAYLQYGAAKSHQASPAGPTTPVSLKLPTY